MVYITFDFFELYEALNLIGKNPFSRAKVDINNDQYQKSINPTIIEGESDTLDKLTKVGSI